MSRPNAYGISECPLDVSPGKLLNISDFLSNSRCYPHRIPHRNIIYIHAGT